MNGPEPNYVNRLVKHILETVQTVEGLTPEWDSFDRSGTIFFQFGENILHSDPYRDGKTLLDWVIYNPLGELERCGTEPMLFTGDIETDTNEYVKHTTNVINRFRSRYGS